MRVALVYPPVADATQPYSSLPALTAFLREAGCHEAALHDANLLYVEHVLTGQHIAAAAATLPENDSPSSAVLKAPFVCDAIDAAVANLKSAGAFDDITRLSYARRVVQDAWEILNETELAVRIETWSVSEIDRLARARENPFTAFFEHVSLPWLRSVAPGAVGISMTYRSQVLASITLALMIRRFMPGVPVIFGGQIASLWWPALPQAGELFDWCDYLIGFEGETALDALLTFLERGGSVDGVPSLAYRSKGAVHRTSLHVEHIDALPTPDYRELPLRRYLAPDPVLLLNTSRGCYWSKCEFCSVSPSMRQRFRMRRPELVLADIETLQARHGVRCISFGDDCIAPRMLHALASGIRERGLQLSWQCEVRFETQLDAAMFAELRGAGCRNLIFGLESYAPRVLKAMNKGIDHDEIRRILNDCRDAGIAVNLQLFFGFPGETADEARQTFDFATDALRGGATVSAGTFQLQPGSGVARDPAAFGIGFSEGRQPLAIDLIYEPCAPHAEQMRRELRSAILARVPFASQPLGIDAHTLVFLHRGGVRAMAAEAPAPKILEDTVLARPSRQAMTASNVLYDYDRDRAVELSALAVWLLEQLDEPRSADEIARELAAVTGEPESVARVVIRQIMNGLFERGLLVCASETGKHWSALAGR